MLILFRYKGNSIAVRDAQILCKPVIIINYSTAKSRINDGVDGVISEQGNKKDRNIISSNKSKKL